MSYGTLERIERHDMTYTCHSFCLQGRVESEDCKKIQWIASSTVQDRSFSILTFFIIANKEKIY